MADFVSMLWMPIVVSAVGAFIASTIIWMVLGYHAGDWKAPPREAEFINALSAPPGQYMYPHCGSKKAWKDPEFVEKYKRGPWGTMVVFPGPCNMGKSMALWLVYLLAVTSLVGYVLSLTLPPGEEHMRVFRVGGAVAFAAFALGPMPNSVWRGMPWSMTLKDMFDGLVYALITAGVFGALWPAAPAIAPV